MFDSSGDVKLVVRYISFKFRREMKVGNVYMWVNRIEMRFDEMISRLNVDGEEV